MLKSLILFTLFLNIAFAKDRFTEADKKRFLDEVKQEIAEHKVENKGRVDLQIIKPGFYAELEEYLKQEKFTRNEMLKIKQDYENLAKDSSITADKAEEAFYNFIDKELNEINSKALEKVKEGNICNNWSCEDNLKCAPDPVQVAMGKLKQAGATCLESSECVSNECVEATPGSKNKICEDVYRCFRPLSLGESCMANPVCGMGACLPYNSLTSGIGECSTQGLACKKNNDCCSNSCNNGKCQDNFICKDCVSKGAKPQRGQKCCEGLYQNERGICVPDVPPSVIRQVFNVISEAILSKAMADADSDAAFLRSGAVNDGLDVKSGIMKDQKKYETGQVIQGQSAALDMSANKPVTKFERRSDFKTCDIHFRDDFYNALKQDGAFDLEMAMLGFDFVITGNSDNDYWTVAGVPDSSIYSRLKKIGVAHKLLRADTNKKIAESNKRLTCMCLDVIGYDKIEDAKKKKFFADECTEYAKYQDPTTTFDELNGDASGIKAKRLLVTWTNSIAGFHTSLATDNSAASAQFLDVSTWANSPDAKWSTATTQNFDLFKFNIKNPSGSVAGLGALVGALLAAGVIAILGGFATTSILSAWAAAGIITASAATGAGGLWMIASLKGAWITQRPEITDYHVAPRSYSCGKKQTCMEYTRTLVQPYNEVCGIHTSSNACLKTFVVVNQNMQPGYIVDPWIPAGVSKEAILMNQPLYTEKMEAAFNAAKSSMISKNPGASGGGGKKGGGSFVSESYLSEVFIDAALVGKYVPALGPDLESTYYMDAAKVKLIKEAAKAFAISEGVLEAGETANLDAFADYAYENHFIWPKKSRPGEISYPTAGLQTYLDFMTNDVSGNLSTGLAGTAKVFLKLNQQYSKDYLDTLTLYSSAINQQDALKSNLLAKEIEKVKKELDGLTTMNAMLDNNTLDTQLSKLSSGFIADQAKIAGAGSLTDLTSEQKSFLKAVGDLRTRRKTQLKSLATYNRAMASNGDKDRTAKMASVTKAFNDRFTTKTGSFSGSRLGKASSSSDSAADATNVENEKNQKTTPSSAYSNAIYGMGGSSNHGSSSSSSSSSSGATSNLSGANTMNDAQSAAEAAALEAEAKLLAAIEARDRAKKDKYESNDGQTLFEKVTNAYIRNYDKVLSKRKDKDVIEEKQ